MGKGSRAKAWAPIVLNVILLVAWCAFIFFMSSANGGASQGYSDGFSFRFLSVVYPGFADMAQTEQLSIISSLSFPVRKAAHFTEYLILSLIAGNLARLLCAKRGKAAQGVAARDNKTSAFRKAPLAAAWGFCVLFACSDEFHQVFVDGRSAQVFDVFVDACGALLGVILLFVFCRRPFVK